MDSLFANYASSDEEDGQKESGSSNPPPKIDAKSTSKTLFSSLPPPKSSSSSSSSSVFPLPQPKSHLTNSSSPSPLIANPSLQDAVGSQPEASLPKPSADLFSSLPQPKSSSSLFSSLPQPKTQNTDPFNLSPMVPAKRVVQFRPPPINPPSSNGAGSDDDEDENEEAKPKKNQETIQTSKQSLWSIMPAPKNSATLGASSSASGMGRRSIIDAAIPGMKNAIVANTATDGEAGVGANKGYYEGESIVDQSSSSSGGVNESTGYMYGGSGGDYSNWAPGAEENYAGNGGGVGYEGVSGDYQSGDYVNYGSDYADHGHYQSNRVDDSTSSMVPGMSGLAGSAFKLPGKRGRKDVEIVEVKQDELIKNRPREDQVKLTGIAFGPSYQPTTTKGKPSKLHKRKHQIGSLYFDMKQKEMELAERRARGLLTKSQTQGKYGW